MNQAENTYINVSTSPKKDARSDSKGLVVSTMWFLVFVKKWMTDPNKATVVVKVLWNNFVDIHSVVSDLFLLFILWNKLRAYLNGEDSRESRPNAHFLPVKMIIRR